eukprot:13433755-Ditylum_brightwellii.AAC.1
MIKSKESAGCTGSEQASDTGDPYKDVKKLDKETTTDDILNDTLSYLLHDLFATWSRANKIILSWKQPILIDHMACVPFMYFKSFQCEKVRSSFAHIGMIGCVDYLWPDIIGLISTKCGIVKSEELKLLVESVAVLFPVMMKEGHIRLTR